MEARYYDYAQVARSGIFNLMQPGLTRLPGSRDNRYAMGHGDAALIVSVWNACGSRYRTLLVTREQPVPV
jgi:hypothetical protein